MVPSWSETTRAINEHPDLRGLRWAVVALDGHSVLSEVGDRRLQPVYCGGKVALSFLAAGGSPALSSVLPERLEDFGPHVATAVPELATERGTELLGYGPRIAGATAFAWRSLRVADRSLRVAVGSESVGTDRCYSEFLAPFALETALRGRGGWADAEREAWRRSRRCLAIEPSRVLEAAQAGRIVPNVLYSPNLRNWLRLEVELHPARIAADVCASAGAYGAPVGLACMGAATLPLLADAPEQEPVWDADRGVRMQASCSFLAEPNRWDFGSGWGAGAWCLPIGMIVGGIVLSPVRGLAVAVLGRRLVLTPSERGLVLRRRVFEAIALDLDGWGG